jgi:hypothetical protein
MDSTLGRQKINILKNKLLTPCDSVHWLYKGEKGGREGRREGGRESETDRDRQGDRDSQDNKTLKSE